MFTQGLLVWANPAGWQMLGAGDPSLRGPIPLADLFPPEVAERWIPTQGGGVAWPGEVSTATELRLLDGTKFRVMVRAVPWTESDGLLILALAKQECPSWPSSPGLRQYQIERATGRINQALVHSCDETGFLQVVCRILVEDGGFPLVWIGVSGPGVGPQAGFAARDDLGETGPAALGFAAPEQGQEATWLEDACVPDRGALDSSAGLAGWRLAAHHRGCVAFACLPLADARGKYFGALGLCSRDRDAFPDTVLLQLEELAGELAFALHTLRLRTAHAETEAAMTALRNEFQQILEWQVASQTAAAIAHEIGQPLNAVTTFGEAALRLLDELPPRSSKLVRAVQGMAAQAERAGHVVRELMDFLRHKEASQEDVDLRELLRGAVSMAQASLHVVGRISLEEAPDLGRVRANRLQVEKVLLNLIANAMEAMSEAGLEGRAAGVVLRMARDGERARVTVADRGPGLDPATASRVFEPFFTTKARGIGMGLAISRALVEAQGGKLWHEAMPGHGAVFHFTLPFSP